MVSNYVIVTKARLRNFLFWSALLSPVLVVSIFSYMEYTGQINYVEPGPPYQLSTAAQFVGAAGSIFLTYGLVILYRQQTQVQSSQEELMKNEHIPKVELVNVSLFEDKAGAFVLNLSNSGKGTATNLKLRLEIDVNTEIDANLIPKWQKLTRDSDHHQSGVDSDKEQIVHSSGEYLSPEEGEVNFRCLDRIDGRESDGGRKTIDNASFSGIHYYFARVNNDSLPLVPDESITRDQIHDSIDFDRFRLKCTIYYEDIDGEEYQRTIFDYLIPVIHGEDKFVYFEIGMPYEEYLEQQQMEIYQRTDSDPLEMQVEAHYDVDHASEILPSEDTED